MPGRCPTSGRGSAALGRTTGETQPGCVVGQLRLAAVHRPGLFWQNCAYAVLDGAAAGGTHRVGLPPQNWAYSSETSPLPALEPTLAWSGAGAACCEGAAAEGGEIGSLCMGELIASSHAASPRRTTVTTTSPTTSRTRRRRGAGEGGLVVVRPALVAVAVMITPQVLVALVHRRFSRTTGNRGKPSLVAKRRWVSPHRQARRRFRPKGVSGASNADASARVEKLSKSTLSNEETYTDLLADRSSFEDYAVDPAALPSVRQQRPIEGALRTHEAAESREYAKATNELLVACMC